MEIKVRKKGKTRGRPSKYEKFATEFLKWNIERIGLDRYNEMVRDMFMYGTGYIKQDMNEPYGKNILDFIKDKGN